MMIVGENLTPEIIKKSAEYVQSHILSCTAQGINSFKIKLGVDESCAYLHTMEFLKELFKTGKLAYAKTGYGNFYNEGMVASALVAPTKKYQGWTNYETWLTNMFYTNDSERFSRLRIITRYAYKQAASTDIFSKKQSATIKLADMLKKDIEKHAEAIRGNDVVQYLLVDLLDSAIQSINFDELSEGYIKDFCL